jgi:hypothetical protein
MRGEGWYKAVDPPDANCERSRTVATTENKIWSYRQPAWLSTNPVGYGVHATDGDIGKIDEANFDVGAGYVVVDTGPWIFGKKVMLPAGLISDIDTANKKLMIDRTKDQIKNAPEFDLDTYKDDSYRTGLGSYYDTV